MLIERRINMNTEKIRKQIIEGKTSLGIEYGSTRIKAVLVSDDTELIASGVYEWENELVDGIWTHSNESIIRGLQRSYAELKKNVLEAYGLVLEKIGSIGISAMMHGYLAFDGDGKLLVPFRTWRNTMTHDSAVKLTKLFGVNIPDRWSIAHLQYAVDCGEEHIDSLSFMTTLAGYVHYLLTGKKVLGIGDASGMFPIDSETGTYDKKLMRKFESLQENAAHSLCLSIILPKVLKAGENAGSLTESGAWLLDTDGDLSPGIPFCPPEGDADTGMVATNSVKAGTGNVSAGTSVFSMVVLDKPLKNLYPEIDMITTPEGNPVAMVHCNNCTGDLDSWIGIFGELLDKMNVKYKKADLYDKFYFAALESEKFSGVLSYNCFSGEPILSLSEGRPMFLRLPDADFRLSTMAQSLIFSSFATLKIGMEKLDAEGVKMTKLLGHGGLFKTKTVAQRLMASALGVPVEVMSSAGEGGAWGIAILASYMRKKKDGQSLGDYLENEIFASAKTECEKPDKKYADIFEKYIKVYKDCADLQKTAAECFR